MRPEYPAPAPSRLTSLMADRRGFALEATLIVLVLISVLVGASVASYVMVQRSGSVDYRGTRVSYAAEAGADAVLLIVAVLGRQTRDYIDQCRRLGLDALVEIHDEDELAIAVDAGADIIGVNNRNLRTFKVDLETSLRLSPKMPADVTRVSESGIATRADVEAMRAAGATALLIGEALMRSEDIAAKIREMIE